MPALNSAMIVGGGSAAWLTALTLDTHCPFLKLKLVRPRKHAPIGVGESTQTDFVQLLRAARVDLADFYRTCDATMKCGIFYRNWHRIGDHFWHPFSHLATTGSYTAAHHYQQMILKQPQHFSHEQYYRAVHTSYDACVTEGQVAAEAALALHVDAVSITRYFERLLTRVAVIEADDVQVKTCEGRVDAVLLDGGRSETADLYVDCTGFAKALHQQVAVPDYLAYEANVNRAVAAQLPYQDIDTELRPYTRAEAHEYGWTWTIPLQSRIGSGYVYHGDFCSRERAEENFRHYWGEDRMRDVSVQHIAFDSQSLRNPWESNVVAIGLSAGFVEPLEATGLNWTITSANLLSEAIVNRYFDRDISNRYNTSILGYIHDVQDFIDMHYKLSARRDSEFWRYQTSRAYPERLEARLALYAEAMPNDANRLKTSPWAFNEVSWLDILNGYHFPYRQLSIPPEQEKQAAEALNSIAFSIKKGVAPVSCMPGTV